MQIHAVLLPPRPPRQARAGQYRAACDFSVVAAGRAVFGQHQIKYLL
jgi:hypothetical protein